MKSHDIPLKGETFEEKLEHLRTRIDLLPESQRPRLYDLADAIQQQHRQSSVLSRAVGRER